MIFSIGLMSILLTVLSASAQNLVWEQTNGPYGGDIRALLATPDGILYAGILDGGIFRSEDGGKSWTPVNKGLKNTDIYSLVVLDTKLFAATGVKGVFRSNNGGKSWASANKGLKNPYVVSLVALGRTLYASNSWGQSFVLTIVGNHGMRYYCDVSPLRSLFQARRSMQVLQVASFVLTMVANLGMGTTRA